VKMITGDPGHGLAIGPAQIGLPPGDAVCGGGGQRSWRPLTPEAWPPARSHHVVCRVAPTQNWNLVAKPLQAHAP